MQVETEDLRLRTQSMLASLSEEQVLLVLAYAQCLRDRETLPASGLEDLLEETA